VLADRGAERGQVAGRRLVDPSRDLREQVAESATVVHRRHWDKRAAEDSQAQDKQAQDNQPEDIVAEDVVAERSSEECQLAGKLDSPAGQPARACQLVLDTATETRPVAEKRLSVVDPALAFWAKIKELPPAEVPLPCCISSKLLHSSFFLESWQ